MEWIEVLQYLASERTNMRQETVNSDRACSLHCILDDMAYQGTSLQESGPAPIEDDPGDNLEGHVPFCESSAKTVT